MRFKDVFSIIGPAMVGPSSSHTAGAARIGRFARQLFGSLPASAAVSFYGSFAATYRGHGTDIAIIGGLLDWQTDDERIPESPAIAEENGMQVDFRQGMGLYAHPNTVKLALSSGGATSGKTLSLTGASIGGGNIEITEIDGFHVKLTGAYPTVIIKHRDWAGVVANITAVLRKNDFNIAHMSVDRKGRSGEALTALELDGALSEQLMSELRAIDNVSAVNAVNLL